jgi:uncharacterized protein (TIGR02186 family)
MRNFFLIFTFLFFLQTLENTSFSSPIISGISKNEINIDTKFQGEKILLFGAKEDVGNVIVAVRGPKKKFLITKKDKLLGIWYNQDRFLFDDVHSMYSLFSTISDYSIGNKIFSQLELDDKQIKISGNNLDAKEFRMELINHLEKENLYSFNKVKIDFLNETLFKVIIDFPKNISRGAYNVEIYLINENGLASFQSIPIYVNQVGMSARILDFSDQQSFLYAIIVVLMALVFGWLANYIFARFFTK